MRRGSASSSGQRRSQQSKQKQSELPICERTKKRPHGKPADVFIHENRILAERAFYRCYRLCQPDIFIKQLSSHFAKTLKIIVKVRINNHNLRHNLLGKL